MFSLSRSGCRFYLIHAISGCLFYQDPPYAIHRLELVRPINSIVAAINEHNSATHAPGFRTHQEAGNGGLIIGTGRFRIAGQQTINVTRRVVFGGCRGALANFTDRCLAALGARQICNDIGILDVDHNHRMAVLLETRSDAGANAGGAACHCV